MNLSELIKRNIFILKFTNDFIESLKSNPHAVVYTIRCENIDGLLIIGRSLTWTIKEYAGPENSQKYAPWVLVSINHFYGLPKKYKKVVDLIESNKYEQARKIFLR